MFGKDCHAIIFFVLCVFGGNVAHYNLASHKGGRVKEGKNESANKKNHSRTRRGVALIVSMIFILVFSAIAVSMAQLSGANVQIADNHRYINRALESAQSGLEIIRHHLADVSISGSATDRLQAIATDMQTNLTTAGITNITASYDPSTTTVNIASVSLDSGSSQTFSATITQPTTDTIQMNITGTSGQSSRQITTTFDFTPVASRVFDHAIATRAPLSLSTGASVTGFNGSGEAEVYIESNNYTQALTMTGNAEIAGDVSIVNPLGTASVDTGATIGGESGQDAIDNHVTVGAGAIEFPTPDTSIFEPYATTIIDASSDTTGNDTLENIRILANANPDFSGTIVVNGVIFIETPNQVVFSGNSSVTGVIVTNGDMDSPNGTDSISFTASVDTLPVSQLPADPAFDGIRDLTGTFIMAPGFKLNFGGSFETINGAIAGNGINFTGNAGGTFTNALLNYSEDLPVTLAGNNTIILDRSASASIPSGFSTNLTLEFQPDSYAEVTY